MVRPPNYRMTAPTHANRATNQPTNQLLCASHVPPNGATSHPPWTCGFGLADLIALLALLASLVPDALAELPPEHLPVGEPLSLRERERSSLGAMGAGQWTGQFRTRPHALLNVTQFDHVDEWVATLSRGARRTLAKAGAHAHMHTCTHARMHTYTHAHMRAYTHVRMHACTHAH